MNAGDIVRLIRQRHDERAGWTVFEQLIAGTGWSRTTQRFCDALALQTFPSRGISAHGYEVKVSRQDLIAELRQPHKAHAFQRWCEHWWLALPDDAIHEGLVIPDTWGILVVKKGKLRPTREAPKLTPEPWDKPFCAAVARAFAKGMVPKRELDELEAKIEAEVEARVGPAVERELARRRDEHAVVTKELETLKAALEKFRATSGVDLTPWYAGDVGDAVRVVLRLMRQGPTALGSIERGAESALELARAARAALDEVAKRQETT